MAVYMGSSIVAPATGLIMEEFGVNEQLASMTLSMYVLAYGMGPMIFSPLSEIPAIGRNPPYILTYGLFVVLIVPTALVTNFPGLIVLRFLLGFFGSPCLATGGASLQDMYSIIKMPYLMSVWAMSATMGPALAPIISGFSVAAKGWRWSVWEMLWLSGPIFLAMLVFLPETSPDAILLRRAQRLRASASATGNPRLRSQSEISQANTRVGQLVAENLYRPVQMMVLDPAIGFTALYTALIYGIFYSFFEAFPLVYMDMYGFTLGRMGLAFLSISAGVAVAVASYYAYLYRVVEPFMRANGLGAPERRLIPALVATFLCPVGLFLFGWSARPHVHWIVPTVGISVFTVGIFIVIQCIFVFLPMTYPQYAASLFAGNDFTRSTLAAGAIHFSRPLFLNLGVNRGVSLLGGLTAGCCVGLYALWYYGAALRAKSRFAAK
jgi:DHA1 family multidrug resistance protein-like MFS transporter